MSENPSTPTDPAKPAPAANPTPRGPGGDFNRYQAGRGGPAMMLGWAVPPSYAQMPPGMPPGMAPGMAGPMPGGPPGSAPQPPASIDMGALTDTLGTTVRLGVNLLNALLSSSASALAGVAAMTQNAGPYGGHGGHCGCHGEQNCGYDCCAVMGCSCCNPGVNGC